MKRVQTFRRPRVLILGYSSIVQRRVIPAMLSLDWPFDIASAHSHGKAASDGLSAGRLYSSYEEALEENRADLVYISLVNSLHAAWIDRALRCGYHVIVDKPAFVSQIDAQRICQLALERERLLSEALVFSFHPQFKLIQSLFRDRGQHPTTICTVFSFPPLPSSNFRMHRDLGGGALLDLGPYALAVGVELFHENPIEIVCRITNYPEEYDVETAFSLLMQFSGGRSVVGHFGFSSEYENSVLVLSRCVSVHLNRLFTIPADLGNEITVRANNEVSTATAPVADCFVAFLEHISRAMMEGKAREETLRTLSRSLLLAQLVRAAGE